MFYSKTANKIWLEANTERSESNPGRSLGVNMIYKTAVWKTVPCWRAEGAYQCGTVFQTALFSLVIIPRLRPGLLSLRSVLSSRQYCLLLIHICALATSINYWYTLSTQMPIFCYWWLLWSVAIRFGWKPIPSEARVTRDAVSGLPWYIKQLSGRQYLVDEPKEHNNVVLSSRQLSSP